MNTILVVGVTFVVVAGFILIRFEYNQLRKKKMTGRGGDFEE